MLNRYDFCKFGIPVFLLQLPDHCRGLNCQKVYFMASIYHPRRLLTLVTFILVIHTHTFGQDKTHSERIGALSPQEQLARFTVADGFIIELVASEIDGVVKPIDLTFDDAGRLWTQTARMYPLDPIADIQWQDLLALMEDEEKQREYPAFRRVLDLYQGKASGTDKILILDDFYGKNDVTVSVFAEELAIPMSILPYKNGVYVAQGSELFFLDDADHDGRADSRQRLFTGFGFTDSHTMAHTLIRGPGGWIYFSQGALNKGKVTSLISGEDLRLDFSKIARFRLDGSKMELVNVGLNNIWGYQLRGDGQWFATEANDLGYSVVPLEPGTGFPGIGNERLRSYQPFMPTLHNFRVGGTGISGLAFADDASGSFPEEYKNVAFLANPITSTVNAVRIVRHPDGRVSAEHLEDLLQCEDDWFRPVNMEFGPDGCLYIADWYNKIVSHNELPTTHPDRDKTRGRIWRLRHKDQQVKPVPDFYVMETVKLPGYLYHPSLWAKRAVWHQISDRPIAETVKLEPKLIQIVEDPNADLDTRIHALWCLESLGTFRDEWMSRVLGSEQASLVREGIRALVSFDLDISTVANLLLPFVEDTNAMIRSQVLRTLEEVGAANSSSIGILVRSCRPEIEGQGMGGPYERKFERYLARKALEKYPEALMKYLETVDFAEISPWNMLWASQALPEEKREALFFKYWPEIKTETLSESDFVALMTMIANPGIFGEMEDYLYDNPKIEIYIQYALNHQGQIRSEALSILFGGPVRALLQSGKKHTELAFQAINELEIKGLDGDLKNLDKNMYTNATLTTILKVLGREPGLHLSFWEEIVGDSSLDLQLRLTGLLFAIQADQMLGIRLIDRHFAQLENEKRKEMIRFFSSDKKGAEVILKLYRSGYLISHLFDDETVNRIVEITASSEGSMLLKSNFENKDKKDETIPGHLDQYLALVRDTQGDVDRGRQLFKACLMCHRVGNEGQDIAPALDGSKNRTEKALLTAILYPNAAVESGYSMYRVVRKNGNFTEGFLVETNDRGTTLAFMGGSHAFIPKEDIQSEAFLVGKSFMPEGLIGHYSNQEVADLITYIRSLE